MSDTEQLDDLDDVTAETITRFEILDIQDTTPAPPVPARQGPARDEALKAQQEQTAREVHRVELLRYREVRGFANADFPHVPNLATDEDTDDQVEEVVNRVVPVVYDCTSCGDDHPLENMLVAPCDHRFCAECLESLYRASMKDETLFPPRCHGAPFPYEDASRLLSPELRVEFSAKREELADRNKLYCSVPTCSAYIPAGDRSGRTAACTKCGMSTCTDCKLSYRGHTAVCPRDPDTMDVLSIAQREGWRRCDSCKTMVELNTGCNHMT